MNDRSIIRYDDVTLRIRDRILFENTRWSMLEGENWAVLGPNGSGKSTFVRAIWGGTPLRSGRVVCRLNGKDTPTHPASVKNKIGYVSFELHQNLMAKERFQEDLREYAGKEDEITRAKDVILSGFSADDEEENALQEKLQKIADRMGIGALTERNITHLSTGEMRKTLIARALMKSPRVLILDEPFDGLDTGSRKSLSESVNALMDGDTRVILITHRLEEIPSSITHVLLVKDCRLYGRGSKADMLTSGRISGLYGCLIRVEEKDGAYCMLSSASCPKEDKLGYRSEKSAKQQSNEAVIEMPVIEMNDVGRYCPETGTFRSRQVSCRDFFLSLGHSEAGLGSG